jgi:hypothetical protein
MNQTPNLNKALSIAQGEFKTITFNSTARVQMKAGGSYEFSYADLGHVIDCTRPALVKNGLSISSRIESSALFVDLRHESGEMISSSLPIRLTERPQDLGSLITYYRRYLICGLLGVTAETDDDAGAASGDETKIEQSGPKKDLTRRESSPGPVKIESPGDYQLTFGKEKGRTLASLGVMDVSKKIKWIKESADPKFRETAGCKEFMKYADQFLKSPSTPKPNELDAALDGWKEEEFT